MSFSKAYSKNNSSEPLYILSGDSIGKTIEFPDLEGNMSVFKLTKTSNMETELAKKYPEITSYKGINVKGEILHLTNSPSGVSAVMLGKTTVFLEKKSAGYSVVSKSLSKEDFTCGVKQSDKANIKESFSKAAGYSKNLKIFRLALSCTAEYTAYFGNTKALALAAMNNTINTVNAIFERDLGIHINMIARTDELIYINNDPYSAYYNWSTELHNNLVSTIGSSNYDFGHLFGTSINQGNAFKVGCVCDDVNKDRAYTSLANPVGNNFDVDYVAHEMGHQFGATHCYTYRTEAGGASVEPGSGSSVMSYAGIAGSYNIQSHNDPYFNAVNINQVFAYLNQISCNTTAGVNIPELYISPKFTEIPVIPQNTPFKIEVESNGKLINIEENDIGSTANTFPQQNTTVSGALFRSFPPTTKKERIFPSLETLQSGALSNKWEALPLKERTMKFKLSARDVIGAALTDVSIKISTVASNFKITYPTSSINTQVGDVLNILWNVGGTDVNDVNVKFVDVLLSTDDGNTFSPVLLNVPNSGMASINIPNTPGTKNRIMVRAVNNIFFCMSPSVFTILSPVISNSPINLRASEITKTSVRLTWDASPNFIATSYSVYKDRTCENDALTGLPCEGYYGQTNSKTLVVSGLKTNTTYKFDVKGKNSSGVRSKSSDTLIITTI